MTRRAAAHDYTRAGIYHITLHVAECLGQPLGAVVGNLSAPDGTTDSPHTALSPVGQMVEYELLHSIHEHYSMVVIQDYVIMPEHLHFILVVQDKLLSRNGKTMSLGQVIAGFKKGCNKRYWEMTNNGADTHNSGETAVHPVSGGSPAHTVPCGSPAHTVPCGFPVHTVPGGFPIHTVPGGFPAGYKVPSNASSGRQPLFGAGYCDVMPVDAQQLATQRAYIAGNPRSRLQRSCGGYRSHVQRGSINTALTFSALRGYLERECPPQIATPEALADIKSRLLFADTFSSGETAAHTSHAASASAAPTASHATPAPGAAHTSHAASASAGHTASHAASASAGHTASHAAPAASAALGAPASVRAGLPGAEKGAVRYVVCDAFGNTALLTERRCLPVVCHRKDAKHLAEQKARCLEEAARGAVLVSARIAKGEQEIIDNAVHRGYPVVLITDNGFTDRYHPSADRLDQCLADRLLLITPWRYQYRAKNDGIHVPFCKTMNCVAQALCRTKDSWWKAPASSNTVPSGSPVGSKPE